MSDKLLVLLVGGRGVGKSTIANKLSYPQNVGYTDREPRKGEVNGKDYFFLTKAEMDEMFKRDDLVMPTVRKDARYTKVAHRFDDISISIVDPEGVYWFNEHKIEGVKILTVFLDVPREIKIERCISRGDNPDNIVSLLDAEENQMNEFIHSYMYDYFIVNRNSDISVKIINHIVDEYKNRLEGV